VSPRRLALASFAATSLSALALVQCSRSLPNEAPGQEARGAVACVGSAVVDPTLLAFLSKARAAHHRADLAEDGGDLQLAVDALEVVVKPPHPTAPEAIEVVADTRARLADLKSELGLHEQALRDVDAGLALAATPTHFRGHLLEMKGVVLERRYRALDAMGETTAAAALKAQALDAFKAAIDVQDKVIDEALAHDGG